MTMCWLRAGLAILSLIVGVCSTNEKYDGAQVIDVERSWTAMELAERHGLDVLGGNLTNFHVLVPRTRLRAVKNAFTQAKVYYETKIHNVLETIKTEERLYVSSRALGMTWDRFYNLFDIYEYMDKLARENPSFVSVFDFGQSVEGRIMRGLKISSGIPDANAVVIDGGIHAREWSSPAAVTYIMRELVERRDSLPSELLGLDFYLIPVMNPDGYEYTHNSDRLWRKNRARWFFSRCRGVDLNRNFDYYFGGQGTSSDKCSDAFRGTSPASEPETQSFKNLALSIKDNFKGYVTFHSYGNMILLPYGTEHGAVPEDYDEMMAVARTAYDNISRLTGSRYHYGNIADTIYPASGSNVDWLKAELGVKYTYAAELGSGSTGFTPTPEMITPISQEAWELVKAVSIASARV